MLVVRAAESRADPICQLVGTEQTIRLDHLAFAMNPLGLHRIEPRTLLGQKTGDDPHSSFAAVLFDFPVTLANPAPDLSRLMCQLALSQINTNTFSCQEIRASGSTTQEIGSLWRSLGDRLQT